MKVVKRSESIQDSLDIEELMKERDKYQAVVNMYTAKIRELIYKYDSVRIDYSKKA
jgi:hypothetical protein